LKSICKYFNHQTYVTKKSYDNHTYEESQSDKGSKMETLEAIHTRRSIRKFRPQSVAKDLINEILAAAMTAPSAGNQQPWQFVVITDRKILDRIPKINGKHIVNIERS
jgi:hypothetical protein